MLADRAVEAKAWTQDEDLSCTYLLHYEPEITDSFITTTCILSLSTLSMNIIDT